MGIREEQKRLTRENILKHTLELLLVNGLVKVSTKDISAASNVSQGSIFLHFSSKDNLISSIISENLSKLEISLKQRVVSKSDRESFLRDLLNVLIDHENILSRVYKDFAYVNEETKKNMEHIDTMIRNLIFDNLRNTPGRKISIVDSFISIDAFLAQIKQNLRDKEIFTEFNSVIKQTRGKLVKLYKVLFGDFSWLNLKKLKRMTLKCCING